MNLLLSHGHTKADILQMSYDEMVAYANAAEYDDNQKLIIQMNAMQVAYSGDRNARKQFIDIIFDNDQTTFDVASFDSLFGLDTPASELSPEKTDVIEWARREISEDNSGYLTGKRNGR